MVVLGVIVGLVVLVVLVALHELGHAIVARRNGVDVEEFGIGFPPRARAWRPQQSFLGEKVQFSLNWLPLGGFVRLKGEHDAATGPRTYGAASYWAKTRILLAGVAMNWLVAALLFSTLAVVGLPKLVPQQAVLPFDATVERSPVTVVDVVQGSPAAQAALQRGDQIIRVGEHTVATTTDLSVATAAQAGQTVAVSLVRDGRQLTTQAALRPQDGATNGGYLGVTSGQSEKIRSTWSAPLVGLVTTAQLTIETVKGIGDIVAKAVGGLIGQFAASEADRQTAARDLAAAGSSVAGPVGILGTLFPMVVSSGPWSVLLLAAIISLTLAVMNLLPIPALDGGRWLVMTLFRLSKRPLTKEREETIQVTGFLLILLLTVVVTWNDIGKFFS